MKINAPDETFTGESRYGDLVLEFKDGVAECDALPDAVRSYMEGAGYGIDELAGPDDAGDPDPEPFDPTKHTVEEVRAHIDGLDDSDPDARDAEVARIVEAEKAGKNRSTLLDGIEGVSGSDA